MENIAEQRAFWHVPQCCKECACEWTKENPLLCMGTKYLCLNCKRRRGRESMRKWMAGNTEYKAKKSDYDKEYREKYPDKRRHAKLFYYYGISIQEYRRLLESQGGGCAICGTPPKNGKWLCVDHDHETKKIRGLLCNRCNCGIGYFDNSTKLIHLARKYLKRYAKC